LDRLVIEGGTSLSGAIRVHGAKNAALPILAASVMAKGTHVISNVPDLLDIDVMLQIFRGIGCAASRNGDRLTVNTRPLHSSRVPEDLMRQMRSSIFLMGPLLARFGRVQVYQPGGCAIGERKIDLHLKGLRALGAEIEESHETIRCRADRLVGTDILLDFPSVGATENIMMAAVTAKGTTRIFNAAREPEIRDLQQFLNCMGAQVTGAGTDTIVIHGVDELVPCEYRIIPDRIVTGTLMIAAAATQGDITLMDVHPPHMQALTHVLRQAGVHIVAGDDIMRVIGTGRPKMIERIVTAPYPSFPTDLQAQMMVLLSLADGLSVMKETIFDGRFRHVDELNRMGADIRVDLNCAFIRGVPRLYGATVEATDLRAGAALVIAGLAAKGTTVVEQVHHIDRGYERIESMFNRLGARIERYTAAPASQRLS